LVGLITLTIITESFGQVITRVLSTEDKIENYIPWYDADEEIPIVDAPAVDVETVLEEDQQTGREMPRISIKQEVDFTDEDGRIEEKGNYFIWSMELHSENAKSISVRFERSNFPKNSIMYLLNSESMFVLGPIKESDFRNGAFQTDYLDGDHATIILFIPQVEFDREAFKIEIASYYHGLIELADNSIDPDFDESLDCNVNVACEQADGLDCQITSVCKIIIGDGSCSGALINNDCCDLTPNVLSANHCYTGDPTDTDPIDWNFRFNYESDVCDPSEEPPLSQWITYWGANIQARWGGTDFLLLELLQDIRPEDNLTFAGWDRRDFFEFFPRTNIIHHPKGDVKKIAFDNQPVEVEYDETIPFPPNLVGGRYARTELSNGINGDFGILEGGSSGAPYFNNQNRIFAQHRGGTSDPSCTETNLYWGGRIFSSWDGDGTNSGQLRNWLGASRNPLTMNCMEYPDMNYGDDLLCAIVPEYYELSNIPCPTDEISWEVKPANLFLGPTSGIGRGVQLYAGSSSGPATLTYTISAESCPDFQVDHDFFVGPPCDFTIYGVGSQACLFDRNRIFINPNDDCVNYNSISWDFSGAVIGDATGTSGWYMGMSEGYGYICATLTNDCGSNQVCRRVLITACNGGPRFSKVPESNENIKVKLVPNPMRGISYLFVDKNPKMMVDIRIFDQSGRVIQQFKSSNNKVPIELSTESSGLYIIECKIGDKIIHKKLIKS